MFKFDLLPPCNNVYVSNSKSIITNWWT